MKKLGGGNKAWCLLRHALILEINGKINEANEAILDALEFSKSRNNNKMIGLSIYYLGNNDRLNGKYQLALENYLKSLEFFNSTSTEDKYYHGVISASIGVVYQIQNNFSESRGAFLTAMAIFDEIGEEFRKGCIFGRLGTLCRNEKNFNEALKLFKDAASIFKKYSDHIHEAYILKEMGTTYFIQGDLDRSLCYYSLALKEFERDVEYSFYDVLRKGEILYNMAFTYLVKGQIYNSLRFFEKAIVEFRTISDDKYVAFCSIGLGMIYRLDNKNDTSSDYFNEAYNILKDSSSSILLSWIVFQIGEINNIKHNYKKSIYYYNKARIKLEEIDVTAEDKEYRKALVLGKMGSVYRRLNRIKTSLKYYEKSLNIFENLKDVIKTSWILEEMGQVFDSQDQHEKALDLYIKAHELLEGINIGKSEKKIKNAPTLRNKIKKDYSKIDYKGFRKLEKFPGMLLLQGKFDMAKETYQEILKITALENDIELEGKILRNLGKTYIQLNKFKESHECLKESLHIFQQLKDLENIGLVFAYIGIAYREEKYFTKGAKNLRTAIKIFNKMQDRFHEIYAKEHLGALFLNNSDWIEASKIFEDIIINMKRDSAFSRLSLALCYKKIEGYTKRYKNEIDAASFLLESQGASNYDLACLESIKGENIDKAFEYLEISLQKDPVTKSLIQMDPHLVDIRTHEKYRNLIYKYIPLNELKIKQF